MQSDNTPKVLLIPADLGSVEEYDTPLALEKIAAKNSLHAGEIFLRLSLKEMVQIIDLCNGLKENPHDVLKEPWAQYRNLNQRKIELKHLEKRKLTFKLFKNFIEIKRAKQAFRDEARGLLVSIMTTSERLMRNLVSDSAEDLAPVEDEAIKKDQRIAGLAVPLPHPAERHAPGVQEALTAVQNMASFLASSGSPSADPSSSNSLDGQVPTADPPPDSEASSSSRSSIPTSPSSPNSAHSSLLMNFTVNCNIINNVDSNAPGFTINNASKSSGAAVDASTSPSANSTPS